MEMLHDENLRPWILLQVVRAVRCRDRSTGVMSDSGHEQMLTPDRAVGGIALIGQVVFNYNMLAKGLLGWTGQEMRSKSAEDQALLVAAKDRIERVVRKLAGENPGCFIVDPRYRGDPEAEGKKWFMPGSFKPTHKGLELAERTIEGTKWARFVSDRAACETQEVGRD